MTTKSSPQFINVFKHLLGQHDQQSHAGGKGLSRESMGSFYQQKVKEGIITPEIQQEWDEYQNHSIINSHLRNGDTIIENRVRARFKRLGKKPTEKQVQDKITEHKKSLQPYVDRQLEALDKLSTSHTLDEDQVLWRGLTMVYTVKNVHYDDELKGYVVET